jgi:hypothetical protein
VGFARPRSYSDDEAGSPWRVVLYIDARADSEQAVWLGNIFLGRAGGDTKRNFARTIGVVEAVRLARIELEHAPGHWTIGVEGYVRVAATTPVRVSEPVACGIPGLDRPGQEVRADVLRVHDETLQWELHGRCGFAADFDYRSDGFE